MKRMTIIAAVAFIGMMNVQAQEVNDTFIKIENENIYSQCFAQCDNNNDGIVTYAEAASATMLGLDKGGRSNIIENYDFLKYFPNLEMFSVGNTTAETIDMHYQTKLKVVNVTNAPWLKKIIVGGEKAPEITGEDFDDPSKEPVKVEFWVDDPVARQLFQDGFQYVEPVKQDGETFYIVGKEYVSGPFGLWHNGKLAVPCEYSIETIKQNYFTVTLKELPLGIAFKDKGIRDFCIDWLKTVDTDKDGQVTPEEAAAVKELCLLSFKKFIRIIKDYDDLQYFHNLEYFHAGTSYAETVDLSACKNLKELDVSNCRMLKTIILAKGCKPEIKYPVAYKGKQAKVIYK